MWAKLGTLNWTPYLANQDTEELTIRKLTYKNPTMKQKFEEARKKNGGEEEQNE